MKPFGWHVVDRDGNRARNGFTYEEDADLVILADFDWPANAPHRSIPLYASPPAAPQGLIERSPCSRTVLEPGETCPHCGHTVPAAATEKGE